jgi:hypothetical protein
MAGSAEWKLGPTVVEDRPQGKSPVKPAFAERQ